MANGKLKRGWCSSHGEWGAKERLVQKSWSMESKREAGTAVMVNGELKRGWYSSHGEWRAKESLVQQSW